MYKATENDTMRQVSLKSHLLCFHAVLLSFMQRNTALFEIFELTKRTIDFNLIMTSPLMGF